MKTLKLKTKDAYDLFLVVSGIINGKASELEFKDIISLQKSASSVRDNISDFIKKSEEIDKDKNDLIKIANKKISEFREKQLKQEFTEETKKTMDAFIENILADAQQQVQLEISPKVEKLYDKDGAVEISVEMEDNKHKLLVETFEKFAKELYNNKAKMVEMYEALTV